MSRAGDFFASIGEALSSGAQHKSTTLCTLGAVLSAGAVEYATRAPLASDWHAAVTLVGLLAAAYLALHLGKCAMASSPPPPAQSPVTPRSP